MPGWARPDRDERVPQPVVDGITPERLHEITALPRHYGFHATLKAPFTPAPGLEADALLGDVEAFAAARRPLRVRLRVDELAGFLALVPAEPTPASTSSPRIACATFDRHRAPLSPQDRDRRDVCTAQRRPSSEHLERWGYPYVLDRFRFHMTLTGPLERAGARPGQGHPAGGPGLAPRGAGADRPARPVHADPSRGAVPGRGRVSARRMSLALARPITPGSGAFIALIAAMMTMTAMTIDINLPAIPATAADLGASLTTSQLTVTIFFAGFAIGQLVWGPLSDRIGRKPGVLVGTVIYVVATVGCALAPEMDIPCCLRAVQGFGAGAGSVLGRAIIRDLFDGPQMARMLSLALAAFITAPIVAPTIGAAILSFASWRWIYGFLAIYGLVMLALAALFLEESLKIRNPDALGPAQLAARLWRRVPRPAQPALGDRGDPGLRHPHRLPDQLLRRADAGLRHEPLRSSVCAFAIVAVCSFVGNILNSRLVHRLPLVRLIRWRWWRRSLTAALALGGRSLRIWAASGRWWSRSACSSSPSA